MILLMAALLMASVTVSAQPNAQEIVTRVAETYKNLKTYLFEGVLSNDQRLGEMRQLTESPVILAVDGPLKYRFEQKNWMMGIAKVSDGKTAWHYTGFRQQYTKKPAVAIAETGNEQMRGPGTAPDYTQQYAQLGAGADRAKFVREETLDFAGEKRPVYVVEVLGRTLWIDKERSLVLRGQSKNIMRMPGHEIDNITTVTYKVAKVNEPVPESYFTFVPPAAAKEVETLNLPGMPMQSGLLGKEAPDFSLPSIDGTSMSLKDLRGKVVLMDFWATWCVPCREEMPVLEKLHKEFSSKGLVVLNINDGEAADMAKGYLARNPTATTVLLDPDQKVTKALYQTSGIPRTLIVDRSGKVVFDHTGYGTGSESMIRESLKAAGLD